MFKVFFRVKRYRITRRRAARRRRTANAVHFNAHKHLAARLVAEKIARLNAQFNFSYQKIFVKNHVSRWGSCSKAGNLNFNYRLISLPEPIQDYIIVHELCHLKEFNHSRAFWDLVASAIPDYKERRRVLRSTRAN